MLTLPAPQRQYDAQNEAQARAALERADVQNVKRNKAIDKLLFRAPNGSVWALSVSNSGALVVSAV